MRHAMTISEEADLAAILPLARAAVREAGALALASFRPGAHTAAEIFYKQGGSPVTQADLAVDALLKQRLRAAAPGFGWLSEETADTPERLSRREIWVVDPIDGTRAFARGDADWSVAVGLVSAGAPVAGFVYAPVSDDMFEAAPGGPALLNGRPIRVSSYPALAGALVGGPRGPLDRLQAQMGWRIAARVHSLALRLAYVADGRLDAAIAADNAHDWDIAAVHAILLAAGGVLLSSVGEPPRYNRTSTVHPALAAGPQTLATPLAALLAAA
jgi:myo-inositol-1(or 4)-monophosphatase